MPRRRLTPADPSEPVDTVETGSSVRWSPRDMLIPYVLLAVSMQRAHGYLIEEYLEKTLHYVGRPDKSTLYRTLRQLEKTGLLLSSWEPGPTGPARRVYSITEAGRAWLDSWVSTLDSYRGMIDTFFNFYKGGASLFARLGGVDSNGAAGPKLAVSSDSHEDSGVEDA